MNSVAAPRALEPGEFEKNFVQLYLSALLMAIKAFCPPGSSRQSSKFNLESTGHKF
ncbi:MAG: hypothetical protein H7095_01395 [Pseudopedobacter sp.]|nr:hypothetical protein [Deinococcales bacterium]